MKLSSLKQTIHSLNMQATINVKKMIIIVELFLQYRLRVCNLRKCMEHSIIALFQNESKKSKYQIIDSTKQTIKDEAAKQATFFETWDSRFAILLLEER